MDSPLMTCALASSLNPSNSTEIVQIKTPCMVLTKIPVMCEFNEWNNLYSEQSLPLFLGILMSE